MELVKNYESSLVQRVCEGDRAAFREIVEDNKKKIFFLAYDLTGSREDAEDLSQDVFIKAYRSIKKFRGDASLSSWLYRITLNAYLDRKRTKAYEMEQENRELNEKVAGESIFDGNPTAGNPENFAEAEQIQVHIHRALELLSARERSVFVMRHYQGMPGKAVGDMLNISEGTVKSLLSRAVKKLRSALSFYHNGPAEEV